MLLPLPINLSQPPQAAGVTPFNRWGTGWGVRVPCQAAWSETWATLPPQPLPFLPHLIGRGGLMLPKRQEGPPMPLPWEQTRGTKEWAGRIGRRKLSTHLGGKDAWGQAGRCGGSASPGAPSRCLAGQPRPWCQPSAEGEGGPKEEATRGECSFSMDDATAPCPRRQLPGIWDPVTVTKTDTPLGTCVPGRGGGGQGGS